MYVMVEKPPMKLIKAEKITDEWIMDRKGYFLIDPRKDENLIYAHYYTADRKYLISISGKDAESIYYTILRENLIASLMHAAYLGSELQKAEIYLRTNTKYVQDKPLEF